MLWSMGRSEGQPAPDDGVPVMGGSLLLGAAPDLRRDLLGTFERAMHDHDGRMVRFRVGPPKLGFVAEAIFRPEEARQVLATDATQYDKHVPALESVVDEPELDVGVSLLPGGRLPCSLSRAPAG